MKANASLNQPIIVTSLGSERNRKQGKKTPNANVESRPQTPRLSLLKTPAITVKSFFPSCLVIDSQECSQGWNDQLQYMQMMKSVNRKKKGLKQQSRSEVLLNYETL